MNRTDKLGCDSRMGEIARKEMTAANKGVGRPAGPVVAAAEGPAQGNPFSMLKNVVEPLIPLATFTRRLVETLGPSSDLSGQGFSSTSHVAREHENH